MIRDIEGLSNIYKYYIYAENYKTTNSLLNNMQVEYKSIIFEVRGNERFACDWDWHYPSQGCAIYNDIGISNVHCPTKDSFLNKSFTENGIISGKPWAIFCDKINLHTKFYIL